MGGDNPALPRNIQGAVEAFREEAIDIILVGRNDEIEEELRRVAGKKTSFEIVHADGIVGMDESPAAALRKKQDSSLWMIFRLLKEGRADAAVTAGNTGAAMAMAKMQLGMLPSVDKPAIAVPLPTPRGVTILLDAGAHVDCKPKHLLQFAVMGNVYSQKVCNVASPRIGILSIGEEESKGNELTKEAYKLLRESSLSFYGNVEGRDIFSAKVEVIVCDGFVGNIVLKSTEGFAQILERLLGAELEKSWRGKLGGLLIRSGYKRFKRKISAAGYGGALLLGINGVCIISHGGSSPAEMKSAIFTARDFVKTSLNMGIEHLCAGVLGDRKENDSIKKC